MNDKKLAFDYALNEFTPKTFQSTQSKWSEIAGEDEFATEYGSVFEWAKGHIDYEDNNLDSFAYGMFANDSESAVAIVEVIQHGHAKRGLTKLLKLWITPEYWDIEGHRQKIATIMICAMQGTLRLSEQNKSKTVKIYGRSEQMLSILHTVHARLCESLSDGKLAGVSISMAGRWLEIGLAEKESGNE